MHSHFEPLLLYLIGIMTSTNTRVTVNLECYRVVCYAVFVVVVVLNSYWTFTKRNIGVSCFIGISCFKYVLNDIV